MKTLVTRCDQVRRNGTPRRIWGELDLVDQKNQLSNDTKYVKIG